MDTKVDKPDEVVIERPRKCVLTETECRELASDQEPSWESCFTCPSGQGLLISPDRANPELFRLASDLRARNWQLERRNRRMELLREILNLVQGAGDLETTLRIILACVTSGYSIGFNRAFLFLLDEGMACLHGTLAVGPATKEEAYEIWKNIEETAHSLEDIVHIHVAASGQGGMRGDAELTRLVRSIKIDLGKGTSVLEQCLAKGEAVIQDPATLPDLDALSILSLHAFVCTPIVTGGRSIGLIVADNFITGEVPGEEQVNLLKALAGQVGQAIANATRHEDTERRLQELSTLTEVSKGILCTTDLETDLCLIARISAQVLNARGAVLRLVDDETGVLASKAIYGISIGEMGAPSEEGAQVVAEQVMKQGKPALINDTKTCTGTNAGLQQRRNLICVPLTKADKVTGTLTVFDKIPVESLADEGFGNDDVRFLTVLAGQAAIAIENAKLFDNLRKTEARIQELHRHLLRSERLAALGELSSQVAHEIRNPLTAIGGFARSIVRTMGTEDANRAYVEIIIKETDRLERILTEQLCFAKLSPPEFKLEDINKVIFDTASLFAEKIAFKKASLVTDLAGDLPGLHIDADKMKQVFINILQNAIDSIPEGGRIEISTQRHEGNAEVRLANNGPAIARGMLERLFVPFATTKSGGSGLGLAIAYEIVYEHGGTIDVKSEEGSGTEFTVMLPLALEGERRCGPVDRRSAMRDRRRISRTT
jgi:signal transduction histidine kinase